MAQSSDKATGDAVATPQVAEQQQSGGDWPKPGEEGYVHPDGTLQSQRQMEDNRRAAADRAAAGSIIHGAPLATPGPDPEGETAKAVERAENYSGKTVAEGRRELAEHIARASEEKAEEVAPAEPRSSARATQRTADDSSPKSRR